MTRLHHPLTTMPKHGDVFLVEDKGKFVVCFFPCDKERFVPIGATDSLAESLQIAKDYVVSFGGSIM